MKDVNCVPMNDMVMFLPIKVDHKTKGGLIKSEQMIEEEKNTAGTEQFMDVLAVGEAVDNLKAGDQILINGSAVQINIDGEEIAMVRSHAIIAKRKKPVRK